MGTLTSGALCISMAMVILGVGFTMTPYMRPYAMKMMPVALSVVTFAVSIFFFFAYNLTLDMLCLGMLTKTWNGVWIGAVMGIILSLVAFRIERIATRLWYRHHVSRNMSFLYVPVAGRTESMSNVAELAQSKITFAALSAVSACGEEIFYRGIFLLSGLVITNQTVVALLCAQAIFYAMNHIAFGTPAIAGKAILGLFLGISALIGGVLASLIAHLFYQVLVARQFHVRNG